MIAYFDTSAIVPLVIAEPASRACAQMWDGADKVASSLLVKVEAVAALAQARRMGRLTRASHATALRLLDGVLAGVYLLGVDDAAIDQACALAEPFALRGYDAVHCAAAAAIRDDDVVAVSGDRSLLAAWQALGLAMFDVNRGW
jgi:predicted nucleic acid-binding protein